MALNNNQICTSLNKFGFSEYDLAPCISRSISRVEIKDEEKMISMAKECLIKTSFNSGVVIKKVIYNFRIAILIN